MSVTIEDIQAASERLAGNATRTPLLVNRHLDTLLDAEIFLKCENLQQIGAFKFRGAFNRLSQLDDEEKTRGVVAFSSGNHAQGIALAAKLLGMPATIVMPEDAPKIKIAGTKRLGATIRFYARETESREEIAEKIALENQLILVPAFEDLDVIAGQGTCGLEAIEQMQVLGKAPDLLLSPCGGGGLMAGVSTAAKALVPGIEIVGVEPEGFDDHYQSKLAGQRRAITAGSTSFCDALLASMPGELTWSINRDTVNGFLQVSDDEVARAISFAFQHLKMVIEPGGAVALAALLQKKIVVTGKKVCIILSGGNIDPALFSDCLARYPSP
jgi:threonine dehydratase